MIRHEVFADGWPELFRQQLPAALKFQHAGEVLVPDQWQTVGEMLTVLQSILAALPAGYCAEWSEAYGDRFSYLDAELAGELADVEMVSR